jgi:Fe2+ or Zn2+ uptake regulation protein
MELKDLINPMDISKKLKHKTYAQVFCVLNVLKNQHNTSTVTSTELSKIINENYSHLYQILEVFADAKLIQKIRISRMRIKYGLKDDLNDKYLLKIAKTTLFGEDIN